MQVHIYWPNLAIWVLVGSVGVWLAVASAAFLWVKYNRGFDAVQFSDMLLLPSRWEEYQTARGNFLIEAAQRDLKQEKFREAIHGLRTGLERSPRNKEGRLLLAQFYNAWKRPELTRQILLEGLRYHRDDPAYLKSVFLFLLNLQDDQKVLSLSAEILGEDRTPTSRNQLVALAAATSLYYRGNYDGAEKKIQQYLLETTREGRLLSARITWEQGARDEAIEKLRGIIGDFPSYNEAYTQIVSYLRETGRNEEARRESLVRVLGDPQNARARIDRLYTLHQTNAQEAINESIDEIFQDFPDGAEALVALADFAANTGNPKLARRIYDHTRTRGINSESAALMTVEAHVVSGEYNEALAMVRQLQKDNPNWSKRFSGVFNGLQAIAHYGLGDAEAAQLFLNNYLNQPNLRADNLVAVSKRLLAVGAKTQARQVLDQAVQSDPLNQPALTNLISLDLELNNTLHLATNTRKLLTMRRPSQELLRTVQRRFGSDLFLFSPDRAALLEDLRSTIAAASAARS